MFKRGEFDYSHEAKKIHSDALRTADRLNRLGHKVTHEDVKKEQYEKACDRAKEMLQEMLDCIDHEARIDLFKSFKHFVKRYHLRVGDALMEKIEKEANKLQEV